MINEHVTTEEIEAYVGAVQQEARPDPRVEGHLCRCSHCRDRLDDISIGIAALAAACDVPVEVLLGASDPVDEGEAGMELVGVAAGAAAHLAESHEVAGGTVGLLVPPVLGRRHSLESSAAMPVVEAAVGVPCCGGCRAHLIRRSRSRTPVVVSALLMIAGAGLGVWAWWQSSESASRSPLSLAEIAQAPRLTTQDPFDVVPSDPCVEECAVADSAPRPGPFQSEGPTCALVAGTKKEACSNPLPPNAGSLTIGPLRSLRSAMENGGDGLELSSSPLWLSGSMLRDSVFPYLAAADQLRVLQTILADQGAYPVDAIDGRDGPLTRRAVVAFQKQVNQELQRTVLQEDGAIGQRTQRRLLNTLQDRTVALIESSSPG